MCRADELTGRWAPARTHYLHACLPFLWLSIFTRSLFARECSLWLQTTLEAGTVELLFQLQHHCSAERFTGEYGHGKSIAHRRTTFSVSSPSRFKAWAHALPTIPFLYRTTQHDVQRPLLLDRSQQIKRLHTLAPPKEPASSPVGSMAVNACGSSRLCAGSDAAAASVNLVHLSPFGLESL
jgi:hypothetical protein